MKIKKRTLVSLKVWARRIAVIGTLLTIFFTYTLTDIFTITSYDIQGVDEASRVILSNELQEVMKRNVYLVIPGNKIFTYSSSRVIASVRGHVPDVATITMRPVGLHGVKVTVTLLSPLFRVGEKQALTEDGILFVTKKDLSMYPTITIASSTEETVKIKGLLFTQVVLDGENIEATFLQNLVEFSTKVSSIIFPVKSILVEETGDITLWNASQTSKVLFLKDMDHKKTWSTLVSAIDTDPLKEKLTTKKEKLEYLDVRYGNKVFYRFSDMKFQNNGTTDILDDHATTTEISRETASSTSR